MDNSTLSQRSQPASPAELLALFKSVPLLAGLNEEQLQCFEGAELVSIDKGAPLFDPGVGRLSFWVVVRGSFRAYKETAEGSRTFLMEISAGEAGGEVPILLGERVPSANCEAIEDSEVVRIPESSFWRMMASCPTVREGVLANMTRRYQLYQAITLHREKLISLGMLAAGLMHELNNPGAAARRAASQLRDNMTRLQTISLRMTRTPFSTDQLECLSDLQEQVFSLGRPPSLSSLEQSDKEEELSEWLEEIGVQNPWLLASTMVSVGWKREDIACAQQAFPAQTLSDTLNYLDALISSVQLVGTIEESIARVTDLVTAVKKYAYDDKSRHQQIDVRDTLQSTLVILGHKFRGKQLQVETSFAPDVPTVSCVGAGLTQVWTNLLDNAIDAAPEGSRIQVRLWQENESVCVGIMDHGPGIPKEHWEHIYQPFFTTKDVGVGTGLGLEIVHRIVVTNFHGDLRFTTVPGETEFIVRLPIQNTCALPGAGKKASQKSEAGTEAQPAT